MDHLQFPKEEDVTTVNIDKCKISVVKITNENRDYLKHLAIAMYLGERCRYCLWVFETLDDLKDSVFAGDREHWKIACKMCWSENN